MFDASVITEDELRKTSVINLANKYCITQALARELKEAFASRYRKREGIQDRCVYTLPLDEWGDPISKMRPINVGMKTMKVGSL